MQQSIVNIDKYLLFNISGVNVYDDNINANNVCLMSNFIDLTVVKIMTISMCVHDDTLSLDVDILPKLGINSVTFSGLINSITIIST